MSFPASSLVATTSLPNQSSVPPTTTRWFSSKAAIPQNAGLAQPAQLRRKARAVKAKRPEATSTTTRPSAPNTAR